VGVGAEHAPTMPDPVDEPGAPQRPRRWWKTVLFGMVGIFAALAAYGLFSVSRGLGSTGVASVSSAASPTAASRTAGTSPPAPVATPATRPASSAATRPLSVASIVAFGADGASDGDNPGIVSRINGSGAGPWYSSWYTTPEFGNLKAGTGLLLDMGSPVTVSSVQLVLGTQQGADIQVRVGTTAALADLSTVATATNAGGSVRLSAATRVSGRYVLIWFTALPPNGQGNYQVSVYSATVDGAGT
jgi:eukaryotic-like serine/threonine-protein kinase